MAAENAKDLLRMCVNNVASMRPRRMAAENGGGGLSQSQVDTRFNEAAANGRGKRPSPSARRRGSRRFNEAAANGRGKP